MFRRITELKAVGFTLAEIRAMLCSGEPAEVYFDRKKRELEARLRDLERLRQLSGGIDMKDGFKPLVEDINVPFVNDKRVIGKWQEDTDKKDFIPYVNPPKGSDNYDDPYLKELDFSEGGHITAVYADEVISGDEYHTWTRGFWLRKWNSCACAYEIREYNGKEYLIIEWKNGDYRFGGRETSYYVMVRA